MACRIQDYAAIGDGRSVALVSKEGGMDWLCWPEPDSAPLFSGILGAPGGTFRIAPTGRFRVSRRYVPDTNVLVTRFDTPSGSVELTDLMTIDDEESKCLRLSPLHELVRRVTGIQNSVRLEARFEPRPDFGARSPRLRHRGALGWRVERGRHLFTLRSNVALRHRGDSLVRRFTVRPGEHVCFSLNAETDHPAVLPPLRQSAFERVERTVGWWRRWSNRCVYDGPYREAVVRSLLALKLLIFAPSGAVIAAPTTSLPEAPGGSLNWDYRFCWLRDASLTTRALQEAGYEEEAGAFASWLLHSTRLTRPKLRVLYDVWGRHPGPEREVDTLPGWRGSRPVRTGNGAADQLQLDCYGEAIEATARLHPGQRLDRATRRMLRDFGRYVCEHWRQPDSGLWEQRGAPREYTHSRLMCWRALERLVRLGEEGALPEAPIAEFAEQRDLIRRAIEDRGWDARTGAYTQALGSRELDAAVLLMGWHGFHPPSHPRLRSTYARIVERLGAGDHLLYRYEQSRRDGEGAFGICSFWAAEHLARGGGTLAEARRCFASVLRHGNDVGLFSEEIDPETGDALGNFPQAFTHVGLLGAALSIRERERAERERRRPSTVAAQ